VGPLAELAEGAVKDVEFNAAKIYLQRAAGDEVLALNAKCTHLGCNVEWEESAGCFVCHCHGARFDRSGQVIRKPAVLPLRRQKAVVLEGNIVLLDETVKGTSA
jgi:cytochrome b6-f complex iron-sulfur subunit